MWLNRLIFMLLFCSAAVVSHADDATAEGRYLDLLTLYQLSTLNDPRVISADASTRLGAFREREALSALLPQVSADARVTRTHYESGRITSEYNGERYALNLSQVLYDRSIWQGYQRARSLAVQYSADAQMQKNNAGFDLVQRYIEVLAAEDSYSLLQAELNVVKRNLTRVESLYQRQMAAVTDLLEISARYDRLNADLIESKNQIDLAREGLSELVGKEVIQSLKRLSDNVVLATHFDLKDLAYWQSLAQQESPKLHAREAHLRAQEAGYREAKAGHYPRVTFSLSSQRTNIGFENAQSGTTQSDVAAINLQMPLYAGGGVGARSGAAYESVIISQQEFEATRREVMREVRSAYMNAKSAESRIYATQRALESASKARVAAERSFSFGLVNAIDVLDRSRDEYSAQRDLLSAQYSFVLAYTLLRRWTGEFNEQDVSLINSLLSAETLELD